MKKGKILYFPEALNPRKMLKALLRDEAKDLEHGIFIGWRKDGTLCLYATTHHYGILYSAAAILSDQARKSLNDKIVDE